MSIIFRQVEEIRSGRKTQTRRVCKENESLSVEEFSNMHKVFYRNTAVIKDMYGNSPRTKWRVGREYAAVPKMYQPAFGRARITAIRQERLHDITEADAQAEGVASVAEYRDLWESINGKTKGARWADNPFVWVLSFEYVRDVERND